MSPFKCIDWPKKKGGSNPGPPGSANEAPDLGHVWISILFLKTKVKTVGQYRPQIAAVSVKL